MNHVAQYLDLNCFQGVQLGMVRQDRPASQWPYEQSLVQAPSQDLDTCAAIVDVDLR
jgi:hypothetical protein